MPPFPPCRAEEPFTGGAYSSVLGPGGWTVFGRAWERPHGRVFWAGTGAWLIAWQVQPGRKNSMENFVLPLSVRKGK